ncbi:MAG: DegV family protein [Clostridia bacterium]|nr:DegV family protein [Clostridia bacterium]
MGNYIIYTDSACDLELTTLKELRVKHCSLSLTFEGESRVYRNDEVDPKWFYNRMREGDTAKTAAANTEMFKRAFEKELTNGNDILYLGFSTGLSTTCNSAVIAGQQLSSKYPERKIICVDTLCASAGFGMLLKLTCDKKKEGATIEEAAKFAEDTKLNLCHWFTVDDLVYLKRGGRVSPAVAFVGGVLGIKPVMHVDNEGHLIPVSKARGRKASLRAMLDKYTETAINPKSGPVYICHGDCEEDAMLLAQMIKDTHGVDVDMTVYTGPVIGAHSGPGTLALFFLGKER